MLPLITMQRQRLGPRTVDEAVFHGIVKDQASQSLTQSACCRMYEH